MEGLSMECRYGNIATAVRRAILVGLFPLCLSALQPGRQVSQFGHAAWRMQDGFFSGVPSAIAQTNDGYLWIGGGSGLTRFDGVRFVAWTTPPAARLPSLNVISLRGTSDGSLWIGLMPGLARLKDGVVTAYPDLHGRTGEIIEDSHGSIWLCRDRVPAGAGPLCQVTGPATHCFGKAEGIPFPYVSTLAADSQGDLWLGHSGSVTRWKEGDAKTFEIPALKPAEGLDGIAAILTARDGSILVGVPRSGKGRGLQRLIDGRWQPFVAPGLDGSTLSVSALLRDRNGSLWIGTGDAGIYHVQGDSVDHFRSNDGLTSDGVTGFFEDKEGNVWVTTSGGVDRFRNLKVTTYSKAEGLSANVVQSVLAARDGTVWIGNFGSLDSIRSGHVSSITKTSGLPGVRVTSLLEDRTGTLWVGVDNQLFSYERGHFSKVQPRGSQLGTVISMAEDTLGDIWVATANPLALVHLHNRKIVDVDPKAAPIPAASSVSADPAGGIFLGLIDGRIGRLREGKFETFYAPLPGNRVSIGSPVPAPDGALWANSKAGLVGWKNGKLQTLNENNGLPCGSINSLVATRNGDLWLSQPCGFTRIPREQLDASWNSSSPKLNVESVDGVDGALTGRSVFAPAATVSTDGKLWFANENILQMIDPSDLSKNSLAPPVHIEAVIADQRSYSLSGLLTMPPHTRDLQVDYTALSFTAPQKVRFRYKLEGWDKDWQDPGTRRQAFYSNLAPQSYVFRVRASNNDGIWNEAGAALGISIAPAFYQTGWFLAASLLTACALVYCLYWLRVRQLTDQLRVRMFERLSERERIARELHDTFFQSIQGLLLTINTATQQLDPQEPARAIFTKALEHSDRVMLEGRDLVLDLRAVAKSNLDLPESLAQSAEEFKHLSDAEFKVTVVGQSRTLDFKCATELHRIGREALYNSFRHSGAGRIEVELDCGPAKLTLKIADDGIGIDDQVFCAGLRAGHWGLPGMQERARKIGGELRILSRKGEGTEIEVTVLASDAYLPIETRLTAWRARWVRSIRGDS
jgi:signal transduction histidine kinase/ligand-binding sensor domain-containing protein